MQATDAMRTLAKARGGGLYATSSRMGRPSNYLSKLVRPRLESFVRCANACGCDVVLENRTGDFLARGRHLNPPHGPLYLRDAQAVCGHVVADGCPPGSTVAVTYPDALIIMLRSSGVDPDDISWCLGRSQSYVSTLASHRKGRSGDLNASMAAAIALCCGWVLAVWDGSGPILEVTPDPFDEPDAGCANGVGLPLAETEYTLGRLPSL